MVKETVDGSDLGRRAARRRIELGLTVDELAVRAKMAPGYVEYLENNTAILSTDALMRLAMALDTSPGALLGAHATRPQGHDGLGREAKLEHLTAGECRRLLALGGVGRVIYVTDHGPKALPVNYAVVSGAIVFRTTPDGDLAALSGADVGFEVDSVDEPIQEGWSVLVSGTAYLADDPAELSRIYEQVKSWAGEDRRTCVRIEPVHITGRRVRTA